MRIDQDILLKEIEENPNPFSFNLYMTITQNGRLSDTNPYINDAQFLDVLLKHYEAEEKYDVCIQLSSRLKNLQYSN